MSFRIVTVLVFVYATPGFAKLKVVTTTPNIAALAEVVGGEDVEVESLTSAYNDPHHVDAKPSFMMKVARADLLISVGLELEIGWLPAVLRGARNRQVMPGKPGSLILGAHIRPIEVVTGGVSRDMGDVHADGNPHFMLDPFRVARLAQVVAIHMGRLMPAAAKRFQSRAKQYSTTLEKKIDAWQNRIRSTKVSEIITYHKSFSYFMERFGVRVVDYIEPKPGVPPSSKHIVTLIQKVKAQKIPLILVAEHYNSAPAKRIASESRLTRYKAVPVSVGESVPTLDELYEKIVAAFEVKEKS